MDVRCAARYNVIGAARPERAGPFFWHDGRIPYLARTQTFEVKKSRIEGKGCFATRKIRKGQRVGEYTGPRISADEADAKYENMTAGRTYLFIVGKNTVIDATVEGGDARFINHSCEPNCNTELDGKRIFIYARRAIEPGEELHYDYRLQLDEGDDPLEYAQEYACHCGMPKCRGTMMWLPRKRKAAAAMRSKKT